MFCPKCGALLIPKTDKEGKLVCKNCGALVEGEVKISEKRSETREKIILIKEEPKVLPKTKEECPKCGNMEAYFWVVQTRAPDEPPTRFFRCTKCGHTWRDYK
ncbi:MAG: transcription factor S [Candidatus Nanoarchaeia archaeon]